MSLVDLGVGNALIASRYLGNGSMLDSPIWNPAKSASRTANWNFSGFMTVPDAPVKDKRSMVIVIVDGIVYTPLLPWEIR